MCMGGSHPVEGDENIHISEEQDIWTSMDADTKARIGKLS